jgi:hypothetical protein
LPGLLCISLLWAERSVGRWAGWSPGGPGHAECWRASWAERGAGPCGALAGTARWSFGARYAVWWTGPHQAVKPCILINPLGTGLYRVPGSYWPRHTTLPGRHRWASTSISMSAISDIRHRHLLFRYRRQICRTEKRHSDIGSVPISTSELIPISDIEEKNISICKFEPTSLGFLSKRYNTEILRLSMYIWMSDIGYRIKLYSDIRYNVGLHSLSPISEVPISGSVRYR